MRFPSAAAVAVTILGMASNACGYLIDRDSCSSDQQYTFVKNMVEQALTMANLIPALVNEEPIDPDAQWLLQQLFNDDGDKGKGWVNRYFMPGGFSNVRDKTGILSYQKEVTIDQVQDGDLTKLDENEVVIFCDTSRLKWRRNDPLHLFDSKASVAVTASDAVGCLNAFMWTKTNELTWDTIQVCPWFLDYAMAKKYETKDSLTSLRAKLAIKGADRLIANKYYTPIDLMSLWDKCMLHEMMHTTQANPPKDDTQGFGCYGWKNCQKLASQPDPQKNADSWALFGSALYYFKQGSPIDANGNFVEPPTGPPPGRKQAMARIGSRTRRRISQSKRNEAFYVANIITTQRFATLCPALSHVVR